MGKHSTINNNNNSSNVLSQQRIMNDLNQMTKNDIKPQFNNNKKGQKKNQKQQPQQQVQQPQPQPQPQPQQQVQQPQPKPQQQQEIKQVQQPQPQQQQQTKKQKKQQAQQQKAQQPQPQPQPQPQQQKVQQPQPQQQVQQQVQQPQPQQQVQQQVQQPQPQQQVQQQVQQPQPEQLSNPGKQTTAKKVNHLLSSWEYYTNYEWKNTTNTNIGNIQSFNNRGNIRSQLEKIQNITEKKQLSNEDKRSLREAAKAPAGVHAYRMKQLLQEFNDQKQKQATRDHVTNVLVKRYSQKMNAASNENKKAYQANQEIIRENLGVPIIKNSQINASKAFSHQKRLQKKAKLQKKLFRRQRKRILESHTSPSKWTPANEQLFQMATKKILAQVYQGFHYYPRPEYTRPLAWVDANENTVHKQSISVATVLACQNSPIPGETRLSQNRVPTVAPHQQKSKPQQQQQSKPKKQQVAKEKPMTIKTQTPEQYRERITGKKPKKFNNKKQGDDSEDDNNKRGKSTNSPRKMEQKASPSIVNPGPATWVTEAEFPDNFAWGILQHQPGNGGNNGRNGGRSGGKKNKDETLNLLFPKSAPNQGNGGNKKQKQNGNGRKQQNRKPKGTNISDLL